MTKQRWVVLASLCLITEAAGCSRDSTSAGSDETFRITSALVAPINNDFEDGTLQNWIPRPTNSSPTRSR